MLGFWETLLRTEESQKVNELQELKLTVTFYIFSHSTGILLQEMCLSVICSVITAVC